ncbi:protein phosphatase 2C domain-containing protein [Frankia sp. Ag45/Mut15]|uniref:Protein phosphatase 2C domain-containing protein n=1 Tax=Frankia umida TaxID=573489 RepID=A0ABT0JT90_9ACTN|nr:PP2C family serine/threonine-protein phosphatase [Frankia umida]MCK9874422.1 protein phosphatase 2C domain-containing protein [Frankia umida]
MGSTLVPIMLIVVVLVAAVVFGVLSKRPPRSTGQRHARGLDRQRHPSGTVPINEPAGSATPPPAPDDLADTGVAPTVAVPAAATAGPPATPGPGRAAATATPVSSSADADTPSAQAANPWDDHEDWGIGVAPVHDPRSGQSAGWSGHIDSGSNAGAPGGGDVTAQVPHGGYDDTRDPDKTGWTPPPATPPHQLPSYEDERENATRYFDPQTGEHPLAPPRTARTPPPVPPVTPAEGAPVPAGIAGTGPRRTDGVDPRWEASSTAATISSGPPREQAADLIATEPERTTAAPLRLAAAGRTRRGKRGGPNEDAFVVVDGLLAVADGVGGEAAGQIASTLTVTTVAGFRPQYADDPLVGLRRAVARANHEVRRRAREEPTWLGMACTLDVVILGRQQSTGEFLTVAHVGDSSVWLQPGRGRPRALTTPHAIRNGPLLNAVGLADEIEADIFSEPVRAGDRVVLASDGITKVMSPEQLDGLLSELGSEPPERAADALVEAALLAGARDDTTIVVADLVSEPAGR